MKFSEFDNVEKSIIRNQNFLYTIISYSAILVITINLTSLSSPLIGLIASVIYSIINMVFLGNSFFRKENAFFRLILGVLLLIMLLGFVGWIVMIIYNLDVIEFTLVLIVTTTLSSLLNRRARRGNATFQ
jgi:uncharacterized membrane protein YfcA